MLKPSHGGLGVRQSWKDYNVNDITIYHLFADEKMEAFKVTAVFFFYYFLCSFCRKLYGLYVSKHVSKHGHIFILNKVTLLRVNPTSGTLLPPQKYTS